MEAAADIEYVTPPPKERNTQMDRYLHLRDDREKQALLYEESFMQYMIWNKKIYCIKDIRDTAFAKLRAAAGFEDVAL
jgi:hypothetical protein